MFVHFHNLYIYTISHCISIILKMQSCNSSFEGGGGGGGVELM